MKKKTLDKRQCRRMLVTTVGRIARLADWIRWYSPGGEFAGDRDAKSRLDELNAELVKLTADLKHYNAIASRLVRNELDIADEAFKHQLN